MRFFTAFVGALLITVTVFVFMQSLIENQHDRDQSVPIFEPIQIIQPKSTKQEPERKQVEEITPEPVMQSLQLPLPSPKPLVDMQVPELDLNAGNFDVRQGPNRWSAPLGTDTITVIEGSGNNAQAFVEVGPIGTCMPNVP
jgi:hypothetical protein